MTNKLPCYVHRIKLQTVIDYWTEDYQNDDYVVKDTAIDSLTNELVVVLERKEHGRDQRAIS